MATAELSSSTRAEREALRKAVFRRRQTAALSEIGKPRIQIWQLIEGRRLRKLCKGNLEAFNREVFPNSTGLKPFGPVQKSSIAHDQSVIERGGKVCKAEPRGYGKTTRTCHAALYAVLEGLRKMVVVFGSSKEKVETDVVDQWKKEILNNDRLLWMYPELIWPLRALENKAQRCKSQSQYGRLTQTAWRSSRIVFPDKPGVPGSGAVLLALPLKKARGAIHTRPNGEVVRPDLIILDDVQTDEDAQNPNTIKKLEKLIEHSAMLLAGHAKTISVIMDATVLEPEDLTEIYLKKKGWTRVRYKMLTKPATREKDLWLEKYADILLGYNPEDPDDEKRAAKEALAFYREHFEEMNAGAEVTWEWAFAWNDEEPTEITAIQHAYNFLIKSGPEVFACECQNEPLIDTGGLVILKPELMRKKQSAYVQNQVPKECTVISAFIDCHDEILYWHTWAWEPFFTGYLINYGTFPNQRRRFFSHSVIPVPLSRLFPGMSIAARVTAGLDAIIHGYNDIENGFQGLMHREWIRTDGVPLKIKMCGIDANGEEADAIKKFIRGSVFQSSLYPSFGRYIGASTPPISTWTRAKKSGDGPEWLSTKTDPGDPIGVSFDTNFWKTQFHRALSLAPGSQGATYVYKVDDDEHHRRLCDAWYVERPKEVSCGSRVVYEFPKIIHGDNHDFDCAVGARVAASKAGIKLVKGPPAKKEISLAALQQARRNGR